MKIKKFEEFDSCIESTANNVSDNNVIDNNVSDNNVIDNNVSECIHPMTTDIENLEDGEYMGYRYEYMFELENGFKFKTKSGVRCSRKFAPLKKYRVVKGEIYEIR